MDLKNRFFVRCEFEFGEFFKTLIAHSYNNFIWRSTLLAMVLHPSSRVRGAHCWAGRSSNRSAWLNAQTVTVVKNALPISTVAEAVSVVVADFYTSFPLVNHAICIQLLCSVSFIAPYPNTDCI